MTALDEAIEALGRGELVVLPTETVYGIGCRLDRPEAIEALFAAKGRPPEKACQLMLGSVDSISLVASPDERGRALAEALLPGPVTLILPARGGLPELVAPEGRVGIRVPGHPLARALATGAGPLVTSSANLSGEPTPGDIESLRELFGGRVGAYLDGEPRPSGVPSTVVDPDAGVLREGALSRDDIERAAGRLVRGW